MNKDAFQKDMLYRHFRAQGWYAMPEVPVYYGAGLETKPKLVTDVDVLGIRPSGDLSWEFIIGDCKTKRNESPANRVLWVRGLMGQFDAVRAFVLMKQDQGIERDHMLFGDSHGVTLLEERAFDMFDRCTIFPAGSKEFPEPIDVLNRVRCGVAAQYPPLKPLAEYIKCEAWNENDLVTMMRKCLGVGRTVRRELAPEKIGHLALILEAASVFAIGFAACVGTIFHQCLLTNNATELDDSLKVLIWGGREKYSHLTSMRKQLMAAKGATGDDGGLALPEWSQFLHLTRSFLVAPRLAFQVPQLLRSIVINLASDEPRMMSSYHASDLMLIKLSMHACVYFVKACGFPPDAATEIRRIFHKRIEELTVEHRVPVVTSFAVAYDSGEESVAALSSSFETSESMKEARPPTLPTADEISDPVDIRRRKTKKNRGTKTTTREPFRPE